MGKIFREKWLEAVERKNSVLCAGLDPAEFEMGRGEKGLPENIDKRCWALNYITAIAQHCAAVKPNFQYWKNKGDIEALIEISELAHYKGMVVIDDSKLADIGSTNEAGVFYASKRPVNAVTYSPFAGNIEEVSNQGKKWGVGIIGMCLMSNPEYKREKNKLVDIEGEEKHYRKADIIEIISPLRLINSISGVSKQKVEIPHVEQYIQLAHDSQKYGLDGIVIGAPSEKNHLTEEELEKVRSYVSENMLVLLPGVGAQGGEANIIWKYFDKNNVIVNVGRSLMFPKDSDWQTTAGYYKEMLNKLRK